MEDTCILEDAHERLNEAPQSFRQLSKKHLLLGTQCQEGCQERTCRCPTPSPFCSQRGWVGSWRYGLLPFIFADLSQFTPHSQSPLSSFW